MPFFLHTRGLIVPASTCVRDLYPSLLNLSDDAIAIRSATAEAYLERLLGRKISESDCVDVIDGNRQAVIMLTNTPVKSVEKLVYNTNGVKTEHLADSGYFQWSKRGEIVLRNSGFIGHMPGFFAGEFNIEVHYRCQGLSQAEQDNLIGGVMHWQQATASVNPVLQSETIGSYSYSNQQTGTNFNSGSSIPPFIQAMIAPYRRLRAV